ncbi:MAG: AraC family transcriptional regulator [Geminicoccaceae bacterium]|nr:AraC family transcriptional regulator [Geminicoccaceae bacterium]MDW8371091.1 AraC family transcriptional regulator [Geminicoccaceae bacterium]
MSTALAIGHGAFGRACLYRLDRPILTHVHREGHLIVFLDGASATLVVDGKAEPTTRGEAIAINPWEPHAHRPAAPGAAGFFLVLYVRPAWFVEASRQASGALRFGARRIELVGPVARAVERVAASLAEPPSGDRLAGALLDLVQGCFDQSWQWWPERTAARDAPRLVDFRVRKALKLIAAHLGEACPFDSIAREAGLSRPHFYKMFKSQLGITPAVYLNMLRVETALDLLTRTDRSVTEIGEAVGFACQSSFTRFFVANVGLPPTDYRRRARLF